MLEIYKPVSNKDSIYFDEPVGSAKDLFQDIAATMNTNCSIQFIQPYLSVTTGLTKIENKGIPK
jgi:hypothetical protein